jgi:ubiquinone/menaquinone biosynthesis C-methylase UbiE
MARHGRRTGGAVIHGSRFYDMTFGWFIRTGDAELLARAGVGPGDRLLDVGTGPGYLALAAARLAAPDGKAVGIDASPEMIARARKLASRKKAAAEYLVAHAERLPFDGETFDVVVSRLVLHHLPSGFREQAVGEMARVLLPGGRLLLADLAASGPDHARHGVAHVRGARSDTGTRLASVVAAAGFTQIACGRLMHGWLAGVVARKPR